MMYTKVLSYILIAILIDIVATLTILKRIFPGNSLFFFLECLIWLTGTGQHYRIIIYSRRYTYRIENQNDNEKINMRVTRDRFVILTADYGLCAQHRTHDKNVIYCTVVVVNGTFFSPSTPRLTGRTHTHTRLFPMMRVAVTTDEGQCPTGCIYIFIMCIVTPFFLSLLDHMYDADKYNVMCMLIIYFVCTACCWGMKKKRNKEKQKMVERENVISNRISFT